MKKVNKKKTNKLNFLPYKRFLFFKFPDGWKDLGEVEGNYIFPSATRYKVHSLCRTTLHVGLWNDRLFYFCLRCGIVLND